MIPQNNLKDYLCILQIFNIDICRSNIDSNASVYYKNNILSIMNNSKDLYINNNNESEDSKKRDNFITYQKILGINYRINSILDDTINTINYELIGLFSVIPNEIFIKIINFLDKKSLIIFVLTNKSIYNLVFFEKLSYYKIMINTNNVSLQKNLLRYNTYILNFKSIETQNKFISNDDINNDYKFSNPLLIMNTIINELEYEIEIQNNYL